MPEMFRLRIQWKDPEGETQEIAYPVSEEDALAELNATIVNEMAPTLGESFTISGMRLGNLRGNPGAPG
jgi:hypothetical protein